MKSTSNKLSSRNLEETVNLESLNNDIVALIQKHAQNRLNISAYSDKVAGDKGFFLMWVKKDGKSEDKDNIQITTFIQAMNLDEITGSMEKVLRDILTEQLEPKHIA